MSQIELTLEQALLVLAVILMDKHGDKVVVTREEIYEAQRALAEQDIELVTYDESRVYDEVAIVFRRRSRRVLAGEVV